jgi:hypothetical protein
LLQHAGLETESYIDSIRSLQQALNKMADYLQAYTAFKFAEAFDDKRYIALTALCLGIDFLKYVTEFIDWEIIQNPDCPMNSLFPCTAIALYSLGEDFTFGCFDDEDLCTDPAIIESLY